MTSYLLHELWAIFAYFGLFHGKEISHKFLIFNVS